MKAKLPAIQRDMQNSLTHLAMINQPFPRVVLEEKLAKESYNILKRANFDVVAYNPLVYIYLVQNPEKSIFSVRLPIDIKYKELFPCRVPWRSTNRHIRVSVNGTSLEYTRPISYQEYFAMYRPLFSEIASLYICAGLIHEYIKHSEWSISDYFLDTFN